MKAIVINSFGGSEVLETNDIPVPSPGRGEVLIKVEAASVNPVDCKIRSGTYVKKETKLPTVLGRDVSGTVEKLGKGASGLNVGDKVYAFLATHSGGYAEFAVAKQNEVSLKPTSLDHTHAAAVPLAATTAWQALFDHGQLQAGQRVLIQGAAGGVGHFAVQFAKAKGAHVIATAGPQDLDLVKNLGADEVINYRSENFEQCTGKVDLVVDLIGGKTADRSWQVLKEGGTMVSTLTQPSPEKAAAKEARAIGFMADPKQEQLTEIARMIDDGSVRVVVRKTYLLDETAKAQDDLEHEHSTGKRVLSIPE